jgi:vacuolar-type H+-ATPase subunit E/Vma4
VRGLGSPAAVVAAIIDEAAAQVEQIERDCQREVTRIAAGAAGDPQAPADRAARLAATRRAARELLAQEDLIDARAALEVREAWLAEVVRLGWQRLGEPLPLAARREALMALAREALPRIPGASVELLVAPDDIELLDGDALLTLDGSRVVRVLADAALAPGGLIARSAGGKVRYDNSAPARARRLETEWRAVLAALYQGSEAIG